jgi:DnaJ-class molecular chaperone
MTAVYDCPKCEGWGWIATDGDRSRPRDCDNCDGLGLVRAADRENAARAIVAEIEAQL